MFVIVNFSSQCFTFRALGCVDSPKKPLNIKLEFGLPNWLISHIPYLYCFSFEIEGDNTLLHLQGAITVNLKINEKCKNLFCCWGYAIKCKGSNECRLLPSEKIEWWMSGRAIYTIISFYIFITENLAWRPVLMFPDWGKQCSRWFESYLNPHATSGDDTSAKWLMKHLSAKT